VELLISCEKITKIQAAKTIFKDLSFNLHTEEHIGIVGPNGSGKSTLLKILAGREEVDEGIVSRRQRLNLYYVPQNEEFDPKLTVDETVHQFLESLHFDFAMTYPPMLSALDQAGFLNLDRKISDLSGGWRKRLAIAMAFGIETDALLLDEPTNHLDLEGILWLEKKINADRRSLIFVSHDRYLLESAAQSVVEINSVFPEGTFQCKGNYSTFLSRKAEFLAGQKSELASMANRLRREEEWLRRGPKARTTKSQSRIDAALSLREQVVENASRVESKGAQIDFSGSGRRTKKLIEAKDLSVSFGDHLIFKNLDLLLGPGTRLGIMGPNGSGKSTLVKTLTGSLQPNGGTLLRADDLKIVYFDQAREQLPVNATLKSVLAPDSDSVIFRGRSLHIVSYLRQFSYAADQLQTPVSKLSGGERARLLIAKLMLQPADVLILDEPTNDLDLNTLEYLEESLLEFSGALILITHDRYLMDRVCTNILALDGKGNHEFYADFSQWMSAQGSRTEKKSAAVVKSNQVESAKKKSGLTFSEKHELAGMEKKIHAEEGILADLNAKLEDPGIANNTRKLQEISTAAQTAQEKVDALYKRWEELEAKNS